MKSRNVNQFIGFLNIPSILSVSNNTHGFSIFNFDGIPSDKLNSEIYSISFSKNLVLGKRIELFFKSAINSSEEFQLIANNIQIQNKERTLGELDFIIKDLVSTQFLHIELMYKFYIYDPEIPEEIARWIGPNRKDSFLEKLEKVKNNQFSLLYTTEAREYLRSLGLETEEIKQKICFKATLFIPKHLQNHKFKDINNECIAGFWFHFKDFEKYDGANFQFYAPEKQDWPINPIYGESWFSYEEILTQVKELHLRKKSPLIWIRKPNKIFERIIVVWW